MLHSRDKHKQREIAFFFYRMPDSCIVFECNIKSDPENDIALNRISFFNDHDRSEREEGKKMDLFCNALRFMLVSWANETLR